MTDSLATATLRWLSTADDSVWTLIIIGLSILFANSFERKKS